MSDSGESTSTFGAGSVLFRQDDPADNVFIINSGSVQLTRKVFREEFTVETLGTGHLCGEACIAEGNTYPETAIAVDEVSAVVIPRASITGLIQKNPDVAVTMAQRLATRLTYAHFRLAGFALRSTLGRVMLQLRHEAVRFGAISGRAFAPLPFDLPEVLACEKGQIDAAIRRLHAEQLIEIDGQGQFTIKDLSAWDRMLAWLELDDRYGPDVRE